MRLIESMEPLWRSLRPSDARRRVEREARAGVHLRGGRACGEVQPGSDDGKEEVASRWRGRPHHRCTGGLGMNDKHGS